MCKHKDATTTCFFCGADLCEIHNITFSVFFKYILNRKASTKVLDDPKIACHKCYNESRDELLTGMNEILMKKRRRLGAK